jgi:capsular exopolysaccharide synthesis family protein
MALPKYEATAVLLVKDEKKGYDESQMIEDLNVFGTKKIVENELEVMQSRSLMKEVVKTLGLYAPVLMKSKIKTLSAYTTSPVCVLIKDPDKISEIEAVYFTYDSINKFVKINNTDKYTLDQWVKTPYGELKFSANSHLKQVTNNPLYFSLIPPKKVVNSLLQNLTVKAVNKLSSVVTLQFTDEVPERAEDILNELISAYNKAGINDKNALADNTMSFVDERLKLVKSEIDSIEKEIQQFRSQEGAINLSEQSSVFLKNVGDNDQKGALIDMQLSVLDQVQKFVNSGKSIGTIVPSTLGISDPVLSQLLSKLSSTELEYERLKNTTGANNPVLISLSNELKQLKPNIIESIRIQRINLKASRGQIDETNKRYSESLQSIPEKERNLLEISRQQTIINNAEASVKPTSPKKTIVFPVALILAFIATFGIIYFKDYGNSNIMFRSEIETLTGFPVIGEIHFMKNEEIAGTKKEFFTQQLYQIIATLGLFNQTNAIKKIVVTSSIDGEGKSFIALNLAREIATAGKKVVLVDLDFIKKTISDSFVSKQKYGVSEFLQEKCNAHEIINATEITNLCVVKSGIPHANYASLISTDRIRHLFTFLEETFDFIIIDTSPIDPVTDNLILSQFSDAAIYIIRHAFTPKTIFKFKNNNNRLDKVNNAGIVFNGVKPRGFIKGFGFGYGYDYFYKKPSDQNNKKDI